MRSNCSNCSAETKEMVSTPTSLLGAFLVVLIPKCHLCVMAYASVMTMCGGSSMYMQSNNWLSYLPIGLSMFIIALIMYNYKGYRSILATTLAFTGWLCVLLTHQLILPAAYYHLGTLLLFAAIWINGNFLHIVQFIKSRFGVRLK